MGPLAAPMMQADGTVNEVYLGNARTAWSEFLEDSQTANGWNFGILSRQEATFRDAVGGTIRDRFAVMRSRRK